MNARRAKTALRQRRAINNAAAIVNGTAKVAIHPPPTVSKKYAMSTRIGVRPWPIAPFHQTSMTVASNPNTPEVAAPSATAKTRAPSPHHIITLLVIHPLCMHAHRMLLVTRVGSVDGLAARVTRGQG